MGKLRPWLDRARDAYKKHPLVYDLFICLFFGFLSCSVYCVSTSFLYPAINADQVSVDSVFNQLYGQLWAEGRVPYVDFYDHKGLYHVLVDALAVLMGGRYALFFLQVIYLAVTLFFLVSTMEFLALPKGAALFALMVYALLLSFMSGGNSEGEFLMPFIAASQFFYTRGIVKNDRKSFFIGSFFLGFEMGLSLNSRPTDIMWGGAIAIYCIVYSIRHKRGIDILYNGLIAVLGLLIPVGIITAYAFSSGFFFEMIDAVYAGGFAYLKEGAVDFQALANRVGLAIVLGLLIVSYVFLRKDERLSLDVYEFPFVALVVAVVAYLVIARYTTYYWTSITFVAEYLTYFLFTRDFASRKGASRLALVPASLSLLWAIVLTSLYYTSGIMGFSYADSRLIEAAVLAIPAEARSKEGEVYALNCNAAVYLMGDIETSFPYFVNQSWWGASRPEVIEKTAAYLSGEDRPLYLLAGKEEGTEKDFGAVIDAYYEAAMGGNQFSENASTFFLALQAESTYYGPETRLALYLQKESDAVFPDDMAGTYRINASLAPESIVKGWKDAEGNHGSIYYEKDAYVPNASIDSGTVTIVDNGNGTYTVTVDAKDMNGHAIRANYTGAISEYVEEW